MVCSKCGEFNEGTKFCTKCGAKLGAGLKDTAPGRLLLKVTGILFIIFAVIGITSVISTPVLLLRMPELSDSIPGGTSGIILSIIIGIIGSILSIILGILGIRYSKNIDKAKLLILFLIVVIAVSIVGLIISTSIMKTPINALSFIGYILHILFLVGAYMNLKSKGGK